MFLSLPAFCAPNMKDKCVADENMVWVQSNHECIPKNPCKAGNSDYCSFYQPRNITQKELYTALVKFYAKVKYGMSNCKFTQIDDVHFACNSDDNYAVFISGMDIQDKPEKNETTDNQTDDGKITILIDYKNERLLLTEFKDATAEICKIIGGRLVKDLEKPKYNEYKYTVPVACTGVADSKCELAGGINTQEFGQKICDLFELQDILNIKTKKKN
jgi:hypothetical protein